MSRTATSQRPPKPDPPPAVPRNLDAERAVLGAILLHEEVLDQVVDVLQADDFFREAHKQIFGAMLRLSTQQQAVEAITIAQELTRVGALEDVGGKAYIMALVDGMPQSTNISHYARIVKEQSRLRAGICIGQQLVRQAYEAEQASGEIVTAAAERLLDLGNTALQGRPVPIRELVGEGMTTLEEMHARGVGAVTGLATGFLSLDELTAGLQPGDLILLAARTSVGKTALAMNIARNAGASVTVLVCSLEMTRVQLMLRLLSSESRVDSHRMRSGRYITEAHWQQIAEAVSRLAELRIFIDDTPSLTISALRARARRVRADHGLGLVVVDYLQLMRGTGKFDNRTQEIGIISRGLKGLAKELNVPILALCQLNRLSEAQGSRRRRPQLSDLRESGDLEQDADVVVFIYRDEPKAGDEADGIVELIIGKQRNGPTGTVKVVFAKQCLRFDNLAMV